MEQANKDTAIKVLLALFAMFTVLKIMRVIDWSWWWVTAPLWIIPAIMAIIFVVCLVLAIITETIVLIKERKK